MGADLRRHGLVHVALVLQELERFFKEEVVSVDLGNSRNFGRIDLTSL